MLSKCINKYFNLRKTSLLLACCFLPFSSSYAGDQEVESKKIESKKDFVVFDEMRFKNKPDLRFLGVQDIRVVYAAEMWPKGKFAEEINEEHLHKFFSKIEFKLLSMVCLDIEHWPVDIRNYDKEVVELSIARYNKVIEIFKKYNPDTLVGFYGTFPIRDYFSPVRNRNKQAWIDANKKLASLADKVDIIFPSIYTFYKKEKEWEKYAIENILQARTYGKKVYPFIWPQYHDSNFFLKKKYIDDNFWRNQLEVVYKHSDGVVIWTPHGGGPPEWNNKANWWKVTKEFVSKKVNQ